MAPNLSIGRISTELNGEAKATPPLPPQAQAQSVSQQLFFAYVLDKFQEKIFDQNKMSVISFLHFLNIFKT